MSERYLKEIDLRLYGDEVECQKYILRARTVLGEVWNRDIEIGGLNESWRRVVIDDRALVTIHATVFMNPVVTITVAPGGAIPPEPEYLLRLAWKPEGIILTPAQGYRANDTYVNWGLPSRKYDTGEKLNLELDDAGQPVNEIGLTENGSLPQVILNRYPNNKYLDLAQHIANLPGEAATLADGEYPNLQLRDSVLAAGGNAAVSYETAAVVGKPWSFGAPDDGGLYPDGYFSGATFWAEYGDEDVFLFAGVHKFYRTVDGVVFSGELLGPQFDSQMNDLITENKAADIEVSFEEFEQQWFVHKPEEVLYLDGISEVIFQSSNVYRVNAGEEPVYRVLRGDANSAQYAGYVLTQSEGHFFHSHPDFLPGYRTTGGRVQNCIGQEPFSGYADNVRENIAAIPAGNIEAEGLETIEEIGQYITDLWRNSPGHYANMVNEWWTKFYLPFVTWGGDGGTVGASHHIGSYGVNTYVDRGLPLDSSVTLPIVPEATDSTLWAQIFTARETWLPVYDRLHEGVHGATGTFNGTNAYSHSNFVSQSRRVGWNKHVYQLPAGLVEPSVFAEQDPISEFLACVGSAMIIVDGEQWIRAVYFESKMVSEAVAQADGGLYPHEGSDIRLKVVKFPIRLMETSELPWREELPAEYEIEYAFEWFLVDGWLSNPPGQVIFNSTGDKFTFTMHKIGDSRTTQALNYRSKHWTDDRSDLPLPRADIQCHHFEWDETILSTFAEMTVFTPTPLVASIECWTDDANAPEPDGPYTDSEETTCYKRTLRGLYEVFPHYDKEDALVYVILDVDEKSEQVGNRVQGEDFAGKVSYCYRVRKMIFPSGKEITYMQQYMEEMWPITFDVTLPPEDPGYRDWPGSGDDNYFCVVHYMDELNEDLIYSKIRTDKIVVDYGFPNNWYRVDGDTDYIIDLNQEPDELDLEAEPRITEIMGVIEYDINRRALNVYDYDGDNWAMDWSLPTTLSIYHMENSPCTWMATEGDDSSRVPTGYVGANTTGFTLPEIIAVTLYSPSPAPLTPGPDEGYYFREPYRGNPKKKIDAPCGREPFSDYTASCYTGYGYYGDSNIWYLATAKKDLSFMQANYAPLFGKSAETEAKVVRYDSRIVARIGINHTHKYGLRAPDTFKPAPDYFRWTEWGFNPPPLGQEAFIWANFDIDEALGIEDVTDIWPMGKIL